MGSEWLTRRSQGAIVSSPLFKQVMNISGIKHIIVLHLAVKRIDH